MPQKVEMIAVHEIHRAGRMVATGGVDAQGDPILRAVPEVVKPGQRFATDPGGAAWLAQNGAAYAAEEDRT